MEEKDRKLIITPLHESKKISQVLANDTCRAILDVVSDEPLSATQVSEKLNLPLTTVDYNIKKLSEVGLIAVHHKRWSPKGKKVNYYAPAEKFILIAPKAQPAKIFKTLKTLIPAVLGLAVISGAVEFLFAGLRETALGVRSVASQEVARLKQVVAENISENITAAVPAAGGEVSVVAAEKGAATISQAPVAASLQPPLSSHPGIIIFIIGIIAILLYAAYKYKHGK